MQNRVDDVVDGETAQQILVRPNGLAVLSNDESEHEPVDEERAN